MRGISENIIMGQLAPMGTGAFDVLLDNSMLEDACEVEVAPDQLSMFDAMRTPGRMTPGRSPGMTPSRMSPTGGRSRSLRIFACAWGMALVQRWGAGSENPGS